MKKSFLFLLTLLTCTIAYGQVGVNTENPRATVDVTPLKTDGTTAEGVIAPNLTRTQLISKDARYSAAQRGAIVYVTDLSGTLTAKTIKVTAVGYYYFDGSIWQPFFYNMPTTEPWYVQGTTTQATGNAQDIYQIGNVAIGSNTSSAYKLKVTGAVNTTYNTVLASDSGYVSVGIAMYDDDGSGRLGYGTRLIFLGTGGNTDPVWLVKYNEAPDATELHMNIGDNANTTDALVVGSAKDDGIWIPAFRAETGGNVWLRGTLTQNSDRRIKTNIEDISSGLSSVMRLRPVEYDMHTDYRFENGGVVIGDSSEPQHHIGFIAQDVESVIPSAVAKPEDENNAAYSLNYIELIPILTKAIQEQQTIIEKLEDRLKMLEKR
ncbi:tail fiber domain-containing protein [Dysgonomonas sp. 520]|uniref:tail fiber domain-containing protein n=1 Tax=Dysgonomonas sp. 520 TaxID=2302931 RepID=UPI0013D6E35D|nr:tail fiber domain-containing protein [Dysgonomonas sp. 520]NDW10552.1 tail fiber domain-containing protein [Dysgonomonas sp. 520]